MLSSPGEKLLQYIQSDMSEKVVVVVSADLAHTHLKTGPYGYSNASEPFDLVCEWVIVYMVQSWNMKMCG